MTERAEHISYLLGKHLDGDITVEESAELQKWAKAAPEHETLFNSIDDEEQLLKNLAGFNGYDWKKITAKIEAALPGIKLEQTKKRIAPVHRVHLLRTAWFRYAAAIILLLGIGTYFYTQQKKNPASIDEASAKAVKNDIMPGKDRAMLTLSNGQQIELNNAASETIKDGTLSIENNNGELIYKRGDRVAMNTMTTPKGGQYQLTLADGTKVWLNAASSITYPTAFVNNIREVSVTGEAYFEVSPNPKQPFVVKTPKDDVKVLGTAFNVNAYPDEGAEKISLLGGSIKIANNVLRPGQAYTKGRVETTNLTQDLAWKNGMFDFTNLTIEAAARQIARWYDVEIQFDGPLPKGEIYGGVNRSVTLQRLIRGMDGEFAHFQLSGKVLHIKAL